MCADFVKLTYPNAYAALAGDRVWEVYSDVDGELLGCGLNENAAWAATADKIGMFACV